jgi:hypothetical protein
MHDHALSEQDFQAALPSGWLVSLTRPTGLWLVHARHVLFGDAMVGAKKRLVPADVGLLRKRVDECMAPTLTYSQWLASGERLGFAGSVGMTSLTRALRLLAICIERDDVNASDVAQALFKPGSYTLLCPVAQASNGGMNVAELVWLLNQTATEHGHADALPEENTEL